MTQVINDKLKKCCRQCHSFMDKPCAWLSLGNEYCTEIMNVQQEIERLNNIINKAIKYIKQCKELDFVELDLLEILKGE